MAFLAIGPEQVGSLGDRLAPERRRQVDPDAARGLLDAEDAGKGRQEIDALCHRPLVARPGLHMAAPMEDQRLADAAFVEAVLSATLPFGAGLRGVAAFVVACDGTRKRVASCKS